MPPISNVHKVFTPTTQARLNFIERSTVNDRLVNALQTPGKQIVVYGESGSGKSTLLLNKLGQLYENHITTRCSSSSTFEGILLDAFDQLDRYYTQIATRGKSRSRKGSLESDFKIVKARIELQADRSQSETTARILPPQLTSQRLGEFLGSEKLCWLIEDFHKVPATEKIHLSQMLKIFSDLASQYEDVRIVTVGATDTAREVIEYDREMANRVAEIRVPLMTNLELRQIIANGQALLNIDMDSITDDIINLSVGLGSTCHHLALNTCLDAGITTTRRSRLALNEENFKQGVQTYLDESSDTLKAAFDHALSRKRVRKYDDCRLILTAIARGPVEGMLRADIVTTIKAEVPDYPSSNVTQYLKQLIDTEGSSGVLRRGSDGKYRFSEPILHVFAQMVLGVQSSTFATDLRPMLSDVFAATSSWAYYYEIPKVQWNATTAYLGSSDATLTVFPNYSIISPPATSEPDEN